MENGSYYHFEFESDSISIKDLKRFREYEASTARIYNAPVVTYVICSSGVLNLRDSITEGINTYRVKIIRLKDENADSILERILRKPAENITRADMIPFSSLLLWMVYRCRKTDSKEYTDPEKIRGCVFKRRYPEYGSDIIRFCNKVSEYGRIDIN